MSKARIGVALVGLALMGTPVAAQAPSLPDPGQMGAMTDPLPCVTAPPGGAPSMSSEHGTANSLPAGLGNAWDAPPGPEPAALYGSIGYLGLQRQRLGHGAAAVFDTTSGGVDTGNPPAPGAPEAADFHDLRMNWNNGFRATVGYHCDNQAFELSGFYLSQNTSAKTYADPGRLDSFFNVGGNFTSAPLGFEGTNGLWLQADVMRLRLQTALGSGEANYRCWIGANSDLSWLIGIRYLDLYERFSFYTGDDDLTVLGPNGQPNPTTQATYSVTAHNQILAPQLGLEWNHAINCWLAFTVTAKGAWGADFLTVDVNLKRGDGFAGPHNGRSQTLFSHLYETGFFLDFRLMDCARLRAGYNLMWVVDVAEALGQLDYDLSHTSGTTKNNQTIFYQGPSMELQFKF
jgi:hypothetical protein